MVAEWVLEHGTICPGLGRPPHVVDSPSKLTVHHVVPLGRGGQDDGVRIVVCRSCNSSKGAR